jgi:hypothetical protein
MTEELVRIAFDGDKVTGTVYHTTDHDPRLHTKTIERSLAEMFGMRECQRCYRFKYVRDNLGDVVALIKVEGDVAYLRVFGKPIALKVGHYMTPGKDEKRRIPKELLKILHQPTNEGQEDG